MAKKKNSNKKKSGGGFKKILVLFFLILCGVIFRPTAIILAVGMLPTIVAYLVDRSYEKNKTFTIGAMNFAGCFPYLITLWMGENTTPVALNHLTPETIIIIYSIAGCGYFINWVVTAFIKAIIIQRTHTKIESIDKKLKAMEERWGQKVSGRIDIDAEGFPKRQENE